MGKVSTNEKLTTYRVLDATIGYADLASPFNWGSDGTDLKAKNAAGATATLNNAAFS